MSETKPRKAVIFEFCSFFIEILFVGVKFKRVGNKVKVMGLANPDVGFAEAAQNIRILKEAIGGISNVNSTAAEEKSNSGGGNTVVNNVTNNAGSGGGGGGSEDNLRLAATPMPMTETSSDQKYSIFGTAPGYF